MAKDFRKKTFGKILRGYAPEEVDEYLGYVTEEYRKVERRAADAERKLALALKKLDETVKAADLASENNAAAQAQAQQKVDEAYMDAVREAQSVIAEAETTAMNIREAAAAEAESKLAEAEAAARIVMDHAEAEAKKVRVEAAAVHDAASEMYDEVCSFKDALFSLYNNHIASVESIEEAAKNYINRVDSVYTGATGETVNRDDEEYDENEPDEADDAEDAAEEDTVSSDEEVSGDIYIDIEEEEMSAYSEEAENDPDEDSYDESALTDDGVRNDDMAMTRVLRLSAISEAIANLDADEAYDEYEDGDEYAGDEYEEEAEDSDEDDESEENDDFEDAGASFRDLDSLFTHEPSGEYSQKDEFDIVFAEADSKRNIEEIRRQPIVPAEGPKKPKKHTKF